MNSRTSAALAEINRAFYSRFAGDFARTRRTWPPGFDGILPYLKSAFNVLDAGCGNGRLLAFLHERGWRGKYTGIDGSESLLAIAREHAATLPGAQARFEQADLLDPTWAEGLGTETYAAVAALAVLHHIPGADARVAFMRTCASLLAPGGRLILSTWQFVRAARLQTRILPWQTVGLADADVEPGDYLIAWGEGTAGHRYCASIEKQDLADLAHQSGLDLRATFYADGKEGNLNLYAAFSAR